jgi:hypothetical protein
MAFAGRTFGGANHLVAVAPSGAPLALPPPGRHVHVASVVDDLDSAESLLAPLSAHIAAIGVAGNLPPMFSRKLMPIRMSSLGQMQHPPLDGPVDLRPDDR